ncbi:hypothetical protein EVAR_66981_1 [Eumeta japonica]|uniref:Reverse transcriptase/retrotransposon-derived protein RNase H-like domain-containing protein n=1 Tax=Eumeta variegata TaxID=151549 RepID=A0A4C1ZWA8_EUMVA|nr:hypothetical protein EVAR_66981_1 [Eumeta japonica]
MIDNKLSVRESYAEPHAEDRQLRKKVFREPCGHEVTSFPGIFLGCATGKIGELAQAQLRQNLRNQMAERSNLDGLHALPEKVRAIREIKPLNVKWKWEREHQNVFECIKRELQSERVLAHYGPDAETILSVDTSPSGLGAELTQRSGGRGRTAKVRKCAGPVRPIERPWINPTRRHSYVETTTLGVNKSASLISGSSPSNSITDEAIGPPTVVEIQSRQQEALQEENSSGRRGNPESDSDSSEWTTTRTRRGFLRGRLQRKIICQKLDQDGDVFKVHSCK